MYEAFYGFKDKPFSMLPDPGFLYLSKKHQAALTLLEYGLLNHVGFCVISGEPGAGKTTILRALLERVGDDVSVGLITNTHQSFGGLLDWVLSAYNLHRPELTQVEMHQVFMEYLIDEYANGRTVLLVVDEAQNLKPDTLEQLRMLSNVNTEKDQLLQVVLAGQPALKETLKLPKLMQFAQRIAVDYHLGPLSVEETCGYIQHRLVTAGAQKDVFTPAACERIFNYSGGTPRLINLLCETVLVYGFADQQEMIDVELVDEMVQEHMKDSVVPIVNREVPHQADSEASKALEKDFPWILSEGDAAGLKPEEEAVTPVKSPDASQQVADQYVKPDVVATERVESTQKKTLIDEPDLAVAPAVEKQPRVESTTSQKAKSEKAQEVAQPSPAPAKSASEAIFFSEKENDASGVENSANETTKPWIKYGVIAAVLAFVILVLVLALDGGWRDWRADVTDDQAMTEAQMQEQQQRELEVKRFRQLQIDAETLKKERDAAIEEAEAERQASLHAAKQAAAAAALAAEVAAEQSAKEAAEKNRLEEEKRLAAAMERERQAKQAAAKAKEAAERARLEAEKLTEQKRVMQIRLEEEERLKKLEEARRIELQRMEQERLEQERLEWLAAKERAKQEAAEAAEIAAKEAEVKSAECIGPAARFKAGCR
jgi:type II secretory pathway predicted ATPase ExeA